MNNVRFSYVNEWARSIYDDAPPRYATEGSAARDLRAIFDDPMVVIPPWASKTFSTGLMLAIPPGMCGLVLSRSGLACKYGVMVQNSPGLIDSDYRGEVLVTLYNSGRNDYTVHPGERIAQLLLSYAPQYELTEVDFDTLGATERGLGGYGSTGVK